MDLARRSAEESVTQINGSFWTADNATCNAVGLNLERQPDADIAGIGVILSFLLPAYFSLAFAVIAYFAGWINDELLSSADRHFFRVSDRTLTKQTTRWSRWGEGLQKGILAFSDTQLVFGIGMLVTGFIQIQSISIYHIQCVTYQAWMSSNVHLTTLTSLRDYLLENKVLRYIRITGMIILAGLLAVALIPTGSSKAKYILLGNLVKNGGSYGFNAPARCFFTADQGLAGHTDPDAPWSFIILGISYLWKIGSLFDSSRGAFVRYVRALPLGLLERALARPTADQPGVSGFFHRRYYHMLLITYIMLVLLFDFAASFAASLYFLTLSLAWGTVQILIPRFAFNSSMDYDSEENSWGFGQILPLLLLVLPALTVLEHFYGHDEEDRSPSPKPRTSKHGGDYYASVDEDVESIHTHKNGHYHVRTKSVETAYTSIQSVASPITPSTAGITSPGGFDDRAKLLPSPMTPGDGAAPLDERRPIHEFFSKGHLSRTERETLHRLFYHSRTFLLCMAALNLGTLAIIGELVGLVLSGKAPGYLYALTIALVGITAVAVALILLGGVMVRSRLFKVQVKLPQPRRSKRDTPT